MIDLIVKVFNTDFPDYKCKLMALAIARRCGNEDGLCWASQERLAKDCNMERKTAMKYVGKLEEIGAIRRVKRKPNGSRYRSDLITLTLQAMTLPATGTTVPVVEELDDQMLLDFMLGDIDVDNSEDFRVQEPDPVRDADSGESVAGTRYPVRDADTKNPLKKPDKETPEAEPSWPVDDDGRFSLSLACDYLYWLASPVSQERSSPEKLKDALEAMWQELPSGYDHAIWFANLVKGTKAYMRSESATNEGGRYCYGIHKLFGQKKFWDHWVPEGAKLDRGNQDPLDKWRVCINSFLKSKKEGRSTVPFWLESMGHPPDHFANRIPKVIREEFGIDDTWYRDWAFRALDFHTIGRWKSGYSQGWGPSPDEEGCLISKSLIEEWKAQRAQSDAGDDAAFA